MRISLLNSQKDTAQRVVDVDWRGVEAMLSTSRTLPFTAHQYESMERAERSASKAGPAWIPGELVGPRSDANMCDVCALVLDFDSVQGRDIERIWAQLIGIKGFAHTSASHTPKHPKWRVVLQLLRPIPSGAWKERWLAAAWHLGLKGRLKPDEAAKNPSRLYYLPTNLADVSPDWHRLHGKPLDIDSIPARPRPKPPRAPAITWESGDFERQARNYLRKVSPAIEGARGDDSTYRVACILARDFGLTDAQALPLFLEWNAQCSPPWSEEELASKLRHARLYGKNEFGCRRSAEHNGIWDRNAVIAFLGSKA